ncbi:MAG: alternative ribosome rescue aminoacyl-tRNA hydrolase ArfB [Candidatus Kapaibacterium sp.]
MSQPNTIVLRTGEEIPLSAISFSTSRSGGPGGQHVNKVETRVEAKLNLFERPELSEETREKLVERLAKKLDKEGNLRVVAAASRSQFSNRAESIRKLEALLEAALKPRKKRVPTKPSRAAKERRLEGKKRQSEKKEGRRWKSDEKG